MGTYRISAPGIHKSTKTLGLCAFLIAGTALARWLLWQRPRRVNLVAADDIVGRVEQFVELLRRHDRRQDRDLILALLDEAVSGQLDVDALRFVDVAPDDQHASVLLRLRVIHTETLVRAERF